jgi:uncharacterized membrane protein
MRSWWFGYGAALLVMGILDGLWLGVVAKDFYRQEMGDLMAGSVRARCRPPCSISATLWAS